jgi:antimicrobial peptide system SdpA family protein
MYRYKYILSSIIALIACMFIVVHVLLASLPFNPASIGLSGKKIITGIIPQGWAFFTRDPREAQVILYKVTQHGELEPIPQRHTQSHNIFGLKRESTKILLELQFIKEQLTDSTFENTRWNYQANRTGIYPLHIHEVVNKIKEPILCGNYVLVIQDYIPWAWSGYMQTIQMPAKAINIRIRCD